MYPRLVNTVTDKYTCLFPFSGVLLAIYFLSHDAFTPPCNSLLVAKEELRISTLLAKGEPLPRAGGDPATCRLQDERATYSASEANAFHGES